MEPAWVEGETLGFELGGRIQEGGNNSNQPFANCQRPETRKSRLDNKTEPKLQNRYQKLETEDWKTSRSSNSLVAPTRGAGGFCLCMSNAETKPLKGLDTHISLARLVGAHISRAPDTLRQYSARPRTRMTHTRGVKGGCGPCWISLNEKHESENRVLAMCLETT